MCVPQRRLLQQLLLQSIAQVRYTPPSRWWRHKPLHDYAVGTTVMRTCVEPKGTRVTGTAGLQAPGAPQAGELGGALAAFWLVVHPFTTRAMPEMVTGMAVLL